jgi:hypothetical protein
MIVPQEMVPAVRGVTAFLIKMLRTRWNEARGLSAGQP